MYYFSLYKEFIKIRFKTAAEYRSNTILMGISQIIGYLSEFIVLWIMISQFRQMGQWNAYELMLIYAMNLTGYSLANFFIYNTSNDLADLIRTGELDGVVTKPTNPFLYLCCSHFTTGYWAHLLLTGSLMVFCFIKLQVHFTAVKVLFLLVSIIGSALIQGSVQLISVIPAFWFVKSTSIRAFQWMSYDFVKYPISIYHKSIQFILTFVIPYAFVSFYPLQYLLGKNDFCMFHPVVQFLTPVIGITLAFLAYRFWLLGLKHYNSSGS